jgi:hypothetical protein
MNAEFHYYAVYFLCARAGLPAERCADIAFSSQYVDNALVSYRIEERGLAYETAVTQNYVFWDEATSREIYLPFHFVPGDQARASAERADGRASRWAVTPDSPLAKELLVAALRTDDDFRIGIALHCYADTWAHQHFSGKVEEGNALDPGSPLPPAGHLQALRSPDDASGSWTDPRLAGGLARVDNGARFREAARKIYRYLRTYLRRSFEDESLHLDELSAAWARYPGDMAARLALYVVDFDIPAYDKADYLARAGIVEERPDDFRAAGYDKLAWARSELARRAGLGDGRRAVDTRGRFAGSGLHRWNEAARAHRKLALSLLAKAGLA